MSGCQNPSEPILNIRRMAKYCAIFWTMIYVLLLPLLTYMALLSAMIFDNPRLSITKGVLLIFIFSLIPLSLPLSIDLMWSSYVCKEYRKTLLFWLLPWLTTIIVLTIEAAIRII